MDLLEILLNSFIRALADILARYLLYILVGIGVGGGAYILRKRQKGRWICEIVEIDGELVKICKLKK